MSEHEPCPEGIVYLEFGKNTFECRAETTAVYVHGAADRAFDHIFLQVETPENEEQGGVAFFRECIENFDEVLGYMRQRSFEFIENEKVSNFDHEMYLAYFGREPQPAVIPEPEMPYITPRQNRIVEFLGYLLENEILKPDDFNGEGALYI